MIVAQVVLGWCGTLPYRTVAAAESGTFPDDTLSPISGLDGSQKAVPGVASVPSTQARTVVLVRQPSILKYGSGGVFTTY